MKTPDCSGRSGAKRGRKAQHYKTSWDVVVNGLARRPSDGRWRVIGTSICFTEENERLAVHRFKNLYAGKAPETIHVPVGSANNPEEIANYVRSRLPEAPGVAPANPDFDVPGSATWPISTGEPTHIVSTAGEPGAYEFFKGPPTAGSAFWPWLARLILEKPLLVSERTGIEWIGYGPNLKNPGPSPTLKAVGETYFDNAKVSDGWLSKSKQFWEEFVAAVGVKNLREITQAHVMDYCDAVREAAKSPAYARQRFGAIRAIINFPPKRGLWAEDCKTVLALCAVLVLPEMASTDPKPIDPADFKALLDQADDTMRAMLLLSLNCAMYGGEVAALDWSEIDMVKGTLVTARNKTGVIRVATLWPRTVEALAKLVRRTDAVFLTEAGTKADYLHTYRRFKTVRKTAALPNVQFAQIRDGAYTSAIEAGVDLNTAKLLAGHATGITDAYVKRHPQMVAAACAAVERAYFR